VKIYPAGLSGCCLYCYCPCSDDPISRLICSHLYVSIARRFHHTECLCARAARALLFCSWK